LTSTKIESGPFADGILRMQIQPMRIDWAHEPPPGLGQETAAPPVLGPFPAAAESLLQLGRRWAGNGWFPATTRIALGCVAISPTSSREEGYQELAQFIDGVPNTPDATDFLYQVNRPRPSRAGVEGLQVNRLSKWMVGAYHLLGVAPGGLVSDLTPRMIHLRLELDMSTSADFQGPIPRGRVEAILDDLLSAAREICQHGNHI
jgi:hypothetical protein